MSQSFSYNTNSFNTSHTAISVSNNFRVTNDRSNILAWISPVDSKLRHQDIQDRRIESIGEWLLQTEEYRSWHAASGGDGSDNTVLFCYGDPGVGKTYIRQGRTSRNKRKRRVLTSRGVSSLVIDSLCDQAGGQNISVACFYFDFAAQKDQSPTNMLGALLRQLVAGLGEVPEEIVQAYEEQKNFIDGRRLQHTNIMNMLQTTSSKKRTFICIDALDECVPEYQVKLLNSLNQILQKSPGTRIFVTGRPHIQPEIERRLAGRVTSLPISSKRDDIIRYLHSRLEEDTTPDAMNSTLKAEILKRIPEDISEMYVETTLWKLPQACTNQYTSRFLLASLNIDAILQETTIYRRRQKLNAMANGLGLRDAYGAALGRIKRQSGERARLGMAALMWISHAERPLKVDELCHALAVEIGSPNLDTDNVPSIGTLLACCQGLFVVEKEAFTVRLIHLTLQEHLRAQPDLFDATHSAIAETCLSYLNSQQVKALSTSPSPDLDTPFLQYSSVYWGVHAKKDLSDRTKLLALKLFDDYDHHISIKILFEAQKTHWYPVGSDKSSLFRGLHCVSFFGIVEIVASFAEMESCDINQMGSIRETPLHWAAFYGHEGVVKTLLGRDDINPDKPDNGGQTPLHWAARRGYAGVVKILLGRDDVRPDKPDNNGQTPLLRAAEGGHEGVVKILLGRGDVNPDKPDNDGKTPLHHAAEGGHDGVVKVLLGRDDVNPDKPDNGGQTPLHWAAWRGREGVVKVLLGRDDVNPNKPDNDGRAPLHWAAKWGREGVVKVLLGRNNVNSDKPDNEGQSPLHWAAWSGHESVVKVLLGRDDVNPDKPDNDGQTPLHCAAWRGREGVMKVLLGRDEVNPDKPDNDGQTPLHCAAWRGREGVVKVLLGRDEVNPDKPDNDGRTPLHLAAWDGKEGVVKILLRRDVNPNKLDKDGKTPLDRATEDEHQEVIALLQPPESAAPSLL